MSLFKKRPQLQKVEHVSPPHAEILHVFQDDCLATEERAAKIRRIEEYARDVLKSRDVFLASARLRGPFDNGWKNPWRGTSTLVVKEEGAVPTTLEATVEEGTQEKEEEEGPQQEEEEGTQQEEEVVAPPIPETEARPASRAGSNYCHDWLKRQHVVKDHSPEGSDEQDDVKGEMGDEIMGDDAEETPSKNKRKPSLKDYLRKQKTVRPDVVPAWTADRPPERRSMMSDLPIQTAQMDTLARDTKSSGAAKKAVSEQPAKRNYRDAFRRPVDEIETSVAGTSMAPRRVPQKKGPSALTKKRLKLDLAPADSPGFVFRRVADGKRPISRGSNQSKGSTSQQDVVNVEEEVWVSVNRPTTFPPRPRRTVSATKDVVMPDEVCNVPDDNDDNAEVVHISADDDGKWPCPIAECAKRQKPYASASNARKHLRAKHGISAHKIVTSDSRPGTRSKTKSVEPVLQLTMAHEVVTEPDQLVEDLPVDVPSVEKQYEAHGAISVASDFTATVDETIRALPAEQASSPSTLVPIAAPAPVVIMHTAEALANIQADTVEQVHVDDVTLMEAGAEADRDSVIGPDGDNTSKTSEQPSELVVSTKAATKSAFATSEPQPDRQDSRAYTTFTFNTQAALLQAHQAFQDTQSPEKSQLSPEKAHLKSTTAPETTTTPFRHPGIPSFFNRAQPASLTRAVPASTQDLMNAAADLSFSTVKKPTQAAKKRISFADWNQAKPLNSNANTQTASLKAIEWSPYVETPSTSIPPPLSRRETASQPPGVETPIRSCLTKKSSASFSHTGLAGSFEQFAQVPKSSDVPVLSYEAMREGMEVCDVEIEVVLDGLEMFLGTGDVDREIERSGVAAVSGR